MEKNLDITKPPYREAILPVPYPFVISRYHCILNSLFFMEELLVPVHFPTRLGSRWGRGGGTLLFGLNGYTLVNGVWLLGSWVFNRVQNFTVFDVLKSASFWTGSLSKSVKVGDKRPTLVLKTIFFEKKSNSLTLVLRKYLILCAKRNEISYIIQLSLRVKDWRPHGGKP